MDIHTGYSTRLPHPGEMPETIDCILYTKVYLNVYTDKL